MFSYPNYSAKQKKYPFRDSRYKREKKQDGNNIKK